jgi:hypothetical protein
MDGGSKGIVELTAAEYQRLWDLDKTLRGEWCPEKAAEAIRFLERQAEILRATLGMLEEQVPHLTEAKFGHCPEQRALAQNLEHTRYEAGLTELRRKQYEASLTHGPAHPTVNAVKDRMRKHIDDWLSRRN